MNKHYIQLAAMALLLGQCAITYAADPVTIKSLSVHLFLTPSGEFSPDVTEIKDFESWNFSPNMEGIPDGQEFRSYFIKVRLGTKSEAFIEGKVVEIEIKSKERKKTLVRQAISNIYFPYKGETAVGFFVQDNVCEPVIITAKTKTSMATKEVLFVCGE